MDTIDRNPGGDREEEEAEPVLGEGFDGGLPPFLSKSLSAPSIRVRGRADLVSPHLKEQS